MNTIESFKIDHTILVPGIYVSRVDGDITTYDLRTRKPNNDRYDYMDHVTMHTFEHLFATYVRDSYIGEKTIYFGPMGCQTGFYLLVRDADNHVVLSVVMDILRKICHHKGPVFGKSAKECGNYKTLNLDDGIKEAQRYYLELYHQSMEGMITFKYAEDNV